MKYQANPVVVEAHKITVVGEMSPGGCRRLVTEGGEFLATPGMLSRMTPAPGDYWVIQDDGYEYLNPKAVFERKYAPGDLSPVTADKAPICMCFVCARNASRELK